MPTTELICPGERCLYTFTRSLDLKVHINMHLLCQYVLHFCCRSRFITLSHHPVCSWYRCPFCPSRYLQQTNALAHVTTCLSRVAGMPDTLHEGFDARYPLLRVWSLGMGLPSFKADGSGDAEMVVRSSPMQVWECAKGSRQVTFRQARVGE